MKGDSVVELSASKGYVVGAIPHLTQVERAWGRPDRSLRGTSSTSLYYGDIVMPARIDTACTAALALALAIGACGTSAPPVRYGFLALLGRDTVSIESVTRTGSELVSDEVDRFPRVRRRHTRITLAPDGSIRRLEMEIRTPSEPATEQLRKVVAIVSNDSVKITKTDKTGVRRMAFATGGALAMAQLPQMYSLTDLYFRAAFARAPAKPPRAGEEIKLRQFYIDREFDRFPLHTGVVRPLAGNKAELEHDWLAGTAEATFDSSGEMLSYSGARTTYHEEVKRLTDSLPDIEAIGEKFATREASEGGAKELSVRDTARATIGPATIFVDYARPLARGRTLLGSSIIPYGEVWRTGANAATQFSTSAPVTLAGIRLEPGMYTLWTRPTEKGTQLIVNKQSGQWGTEYRHSLDLAEAPMATETSAAPVEKFTISFLPVDPRHGTLVMEWGPFRWSAPIAAL
jgi:DUF2911 family protein